MFRSLFPFRCLLATSFLLVFVNVFLGQCWCSTVNSAQAAAMPAAKAAAPTHPGCHGHGQATQPKKPTQHSHESGKHSGGSGCCKDNSAAILKSLATPAEKHLLGPASALLPPATDFYFRPATGPWDRTQAVVLVLRKHLPPKIPDIRIFIQSLTV